MAISVGSNFVHFFFFSAKTDSVKILTKNFVCPYSSFVWGFNAVSFDQPLSKAGRGHL